MFERFASQTYCLIHNAIHRFQLFAVVQVDYTQCKLSNEFALTDSQNMFEGLRMCPKTHIFQTICNTCHMRDCLRVQTCHSQDKESPRDHISYWYDGMCLEGNHMGSVCEKQSTPP